MDAARGELLEAVANLIRVVAAVLGIGSDVPPAAVLHLEREVLRGTGR